MLDKSPKLVGKINSKLDKIDDIVIRKDGTVVHNILKVHERVTERKRLVSVKTKEPKTWPSLKVFKAWRAKVLKAGDRGPLYL